MLQLHVASSRLFLFKSASVNIFVWGMYCVLMNSTELYATRLYVYQFVNVFSLHFYAECI